MMHFNAKSNRILLILKMVFSPKFEAIKVCNAESGASNDVFAKTVVLRSTDDIALDMGSWKIDVTAEIVATSMTNPLDTPKTACLSLSVGSTSDDIACMLEGLVAPPQKILPIVLKIESIQVKRCHLVKPVETLEGNERGPVPVSADGNIFLSPIAL